MTRTSACLPSTSTAVGPYPTAARKPSPCVRHSRATRRHGCCTNDVGVAYGPAGRRVLLALMTRSQVNDPKAQNLRPLIGELTTLLLPELLA